MVKSDRLPARLIRGGRAFIYYREFAKRLDVGHTTVARWALDVPCPWIGRKIVADWYEHEPARRPRARAKPRKRQQSRGSLYLLESDEPLIRKAIKHAGSTSGGGAVPGAAEWPTFQAAARRLGLATPAALTKILSTKFPCLGNRPPRTDLANRMSDTGAIRQCCVVHFAELKRAYNSIPVFGQIRSPAPPMLTYAEAEHYHSLARHQIVRAGLEPGFELMKTDGGRLRDIPVFANTDLARVAKDLAARFVGKTRRGEAANLFAGDKAWLWQQLKDGPRLAAAMKTAAIAARIPDYRLRAARRALRVHCPKVPRAAYGERGYWWLPGDDAKVPAPKLIIPRPKLDAAMAFARPLVAAGQPMAAVIRAGVGKGHKAATMWLAVRRLEREPKGKGEPIHSDRQANAVPAPSSTADSQPHPQRPQFIPTRFQARILDALNGRFRTRRELQVDLHLGADTKHLYYEGGNKGNGKGLDGLTAAGLVRNDRGQGRGYFFVDSPPPEIARFLSKKPPI